MLILKILAFCTLISFTNLIGLYPAKDNMSEWLKDKGTMINVIVYTYVAVVLIGWLHLIGLIMYLWFS
tara:strand:- start:725 stop:928 length:204 start_codon:yes stop_codon:yes gene_type:complete